MSYKPESHAHLLFPHNVQIDGTLTVGVDDTGYDVQFFGATTGTYMLWDENTDDLVLTLGAELYFYDAAGGEHIKSDGTDMTIYAGTDLNLTVGADVNIATDKGLTFGDDGQKIESDGTDFTIASGAKLNLTPTSDVHIANGTGMVIGHTAQLSPGGEASELQVLGTGGPDSAIAMGRFANDGNGPQLNFMKGRDAIGTFDTFLSDGDTVGLIRAYMVDATDNDFVAIAGIDFNIDGTAANNDGPGRIAFRTCTDGTTSNAERMRIDSTGQVFIGDTANANSTVGLTINAGTNTDHHLSFKFVGSGAGFEQPATGNMESDTYGRMKASHGGKGGLNIVGATGENDSGLAHSGIYLEGWTGIATDTTKSSGGYGAVRIGAKQTNGSDGVGAVGSNGNLVSIDTDNTTRFIFDTEGDLHYAGTHQTSATLDHYDDAHLIRALDHVRETMGAKGLIKSKWDDFITYSESTLIELGILGDTLENGGLINMTGLQRLHNGAIWQGYQRQCEMQEQIKVLENKLLALEAG